MLMKRFKEMVCNGGEDEEEACLDEAEKSLVGAFTRGLRRDQVAVAAAMHELWSKGANRGTNQPPQEPEMSDV